MIPVYDRAKVLSLPQRPIPLPAPTGGVIRVASSREIIRAIEGAEDGVTIVIAKGRYAMPRDCLLTAHRVTIRGETEDREDVILDGEMEFDDSTVKFRTRNGAPAIIKIAHARDVTIANLTVANNPKYGILFFGDAGVKRLKIYNVKFHNIWARGLKGTSALSYDDRGYPEGACPITPDDLNHIRPEQGEVRNCLFVADCAKRNDQDGFEGDYIAGMDLMHLKDWVVADNVFVGIRGKNGGGRGSIFIWNGSEGVTVERNLFIDCDRGICLGNPSNQTGKAFHIRDAMVKDNVLIGGVNMAIEVDFAERVTIRNNQISSQERIDYPAISLLNVTGLIEVEANEIETVGVQIRR